MALVRGVVGVATVLTENTCYLKKTGRCSLDMIDEFSFRSDIVLKENDVMFCPRLRALMQHSDVPLTVTPCDCGHVEAHSNAQCACVAKKCGITVTVLPSGADTREQCSVCAETEGATYRDIKALVKK